MPLKNKKTTAFLLAMTSLYSTACHSAGKNLAVTSDHLVTPHIEHWLDDPTDQEKIQQGLTAFIELDEAFMSIASRIYLIKNAKYTLDLQYYIWKNDKIGNIVLHGLLDAADRGVKVRILIDDQNGTQLDDRLKRLAIHPHIQIKIFNPYQYRHFRLLDYVFRMKKINHRMHNKIIIADGAVAVTGGRNISSEYFEASDSFQFTDMDIIFMGTAVQRANQVFHEFWHDPLSYTGSQLFERATAQELIQLRQDYHQQHIDQDVIQQRLEDSQYELEQELNLKDTQWAKAYFVADHPDKARSKARAEQLIDQQIRQYMGQPTQQMDIVSAYFVPTHRGTTYLSNLAKSGVSIRVLTNSYLANDVPIVHAYYQKYRANLLQNGVQLFEFKPYIERPRRTWYEVMTGNIIPAKSKNTSSLHAKFFDIDGKVFIGSFNLDPRSLTLNTEVGLIIESAELQQQIHQRLNKYLPHIAYELKLDQQQNIMWIEHHANGTKTIHQQEPQTTKFQRFMFKAIAKLPFEWLM